MPNITTVACLAFGATEIAREAIKIFIPLDWSLF